MRHAISLPVAASAFAIGLAVLANYSGWLERTPQPVERHVEPPTVPEAAAPQSVVEPALGADVQAVASTNQRAMEFRAAKTEYAAAVAALARSETDADVVLPELDSVSPVLIFDSGEKDNLSRDLEEHFPAFELVATETQLIDLGARLFFYRSVRAPAHAPAADFVSVFRGDDWLGIFVSDSRQHCVWMPAEELWVVTDDFGTHPLLGSIAGRDWVSQEFAQLQGSDGVGAVDWRAMPARGDQFDRQWQSQLHIPDPPARDGIIFRYEGGHRYSALARSGRGNSAHHWNLLAYAIEVRDADAFMIDAGQCANDVASGRFPEEWASRYLE